MHYPSDTEGTPKPSFVSHCAQMPLAVLGHSQLCLEALGLVRTFCSTEIPPVMLGCLWICLEFWTLALSGRADGSCAPP